MLAKVEVLSVKINQFIQVNQFVNLFVNPFVQVILLQVKLFVQVMLV